MAASVAIERQFFELFIERRRASRFIERAAHPKRRQRMWDDLRDARYFEPACLAMIRQNEKDPEVILSKLQGLGCSSIVYLMSSDEDVDGTEADLRQVLCSVWGTEEILGFCPKSEIGFFKTHENDFYILHRTVRGARS